MYYARITKLSEQIKGAAKWSVVWEKVRCPPEQEPLFFKGAFRTKNNNELIGVPPSWRRLWHNPPKCETGTQSTGTQQKTTSVLTFCEVTRSNLSKDSQGAGRTGTKQLGLTESPAAESGTGSPAGGGTDSSAGGGTGSPVEDGKDSSAGGGTGSPAEDGTDFFTLKLVQVETNQQGDRTTGEMV